MCQFLLCVLVHALVIYLISAELRSRMLVGGLEAKMLLLDDAVKQLLKHLRNLDGMTM